MAIKTRKYAGIPYVEEEQVNPIDERLKELGLISESEIKTIEESKK